MRALAIAALLFIGCSAATTSAQNGPVGYLKFDEFVFDFGKIAQGEKVTHEYTFTNTSSEPVVIQNAAAGCGCTVPKWSKEPIMPGQKSSVTVTFDSADKVGVQNKTVEVTTNVGVYKLYLNCIVEKRASDPLPGTH